ncbi:3,4-dehydroadipyl-CoA semialdehyde dehydrogenase [Sphaerotilus mobilis]|uniref:3,4-dehydroadipyl-CoA semialdehyde dehydrogenase n=1 Tax=Sphaerotilus mobilis TaxID=47994 RepID=A0A4Q7LUC0_9BURK|nr:3,4-dehydroadipyl-CoA semialdehyde dehydrogenase [Sphaerotilus mobilis]RZS58775.1 3,4-dehydroadipyl-CoA semialdehyde dehydrogenase [Sphaerotilus mobilis]
MTELLPNFVHGAWVAGTGDGTPLTDPVTGAELVRVSSAGLDLPRAFAFAREQGGAALRALSYGQRAEALAAIAKRLQANRDAYHAIALANSGTTASDTAIDVDGGIYTLGQYARWGAKLGDAKALLDGGPATMSKDGVFQSQHLLVPTRGVALFINAFNFPSWGLWEKAAPALLAGVPVIVKPATATAWLTQRMVADVVASGLLPEGALSVICGSSAGLLDQLQPFDVLSFTGSAQTAEMIRSHPVVVQNAVRLNIEADSLNAALLMPAASAEAQALFVREVVREMTIKSGQKCTAIRRALVPQAVYDQVGAAIAAKLAGVTVGNPRETSVRMGALVNREQFDSVLAGIERLTSQAQVRVLFDGRAQPLVDADPAVAACLGPTLLACDDPDAANLVHRVEVFGPVATLMPYRDLAHALALVARGEGSLVCSLYGDTDGEHAAALAACATELAACHGRVHVISPSVATTQTGHGNVMPQSLHGGPGRAGGGEELGGLRALGFYHRRAAIQADAAVVQALGAVALSV